MPAASPADAVAICLLLAACKLHRIKASAVYLVDLGFVHKRSYICPPDRYGDHFIYFSEDDANGAGDRSYSGQGYDGHAGYFYGDVY